VCSLFSLFKYGFDFIEEPGQIFRKGYPNLFAIYLEIRVNEPVAHSNDVTPGDVGVPFSEIIAEAARSLSDYLDAFDEPQKPYAIEGKQ